MKRNLTSRLAALMSLVLFAGLTASAAHGQTTLTVSAEEKAVLDKFNEERAAKGLKPLVPNAKLWAAARAHSKEMADTNAFSHTLNGKGPTERAKDHGYPSFVGENIAGGYPNPAGVMDGWMNSEGHRNNILGAGYTEVGIGCVTGPHGKRWTAVFGSSGEANNPPKVVVKG